MKQGKVLIISDAPIRASLINQYSGLGYDVVLADSLADQSISAVSDYDEFVILSNSQAGAEGGDDKAIAQLNRLAELLDGADRRRRVHLMLQSQTSLWMLRTMDLPQEVNDRLEVCLFTMEDIWAMEATKRLDYRPIGADSLDRVHLVISGFSQQAEAVAIYAALMAHYPNYRSRDMHPLRTRITIIDRDLQDRRDSFIARHQHFFDNSYYRTVDVNRQTTNLHRPVYHGRRMDFVDIEWEFVEGTLADAIVREHLTAWAANDNKQLSVVVAHDNDEKNMAEATSLPQILYDKGVRVFVHQNSSVTTEPLRRSQKFSSLSPFGMKDCGYDVSQPLWQLAKRLNYFYDCSYGGRGVPTELPADEVEAAWAKVRSLKMRLSNLYNVMTMAVKMRSLGRDESALNTFYALTQTEIERLSATEHNRWSVERLISGTRPCTDQERDEIAKDIAKKKLYKTTRDAHYDLCAYEELGVDEKGNDVRKYDYDLTACIPLIVKKD